MSDDARLEAEVPNNVTYVIRIIVVPQLCQRGEQCSRAKESNIRKRGSASRV